MYYIINENNDPAYNLALEEYVLKELAGNYFILWQNHPTIVLGRHQNIYKEIKMEYVKQNNIDVVRRLSGGGCVYHDLENINYSFIQDQSSNTSFEHFMKPIIEFLKRFQIDAELSGRNDIVIVDRKISGNAQYYYKNRILHHGTLLFDTDLTILSHCLNVNQQKLQAKGVTSVRSRVTNLKEYFSKTAIKTSKDFINALYLDISNNGLLEEHHLSIEDVQAIEKLAFKKYRDERWLLNKNNNVTLSNEYRNESGLIEVKLLIVENIIKDITFYGDFFAKKEQDNLIKQLINIEYKYDVISDILRNIPINDYFIGFSQTEIVDLIMISCFYKKND